MQIPLNMNNNKLVAELLWQNINSPYAMIDSYYRHYIFKVYYTIYNDFIPICFNDDKQLQTLPFTVDYKWMSFKFELNFERSISNEKKLFTLNFLCLQKRKKNAGGTVRQTQSTTTLNIHELLLQNFKFSKENLNWRNLGKQI